MLKTFDEVFDDYTKYGTKIKTEQYHTIGTNIIIDQGQADIAGYTDQIDGLFKDVPVIVFGDHTRIIKYINRPFFLGADGTKILKSKIPDANYKYLYYALKNAKIPNTGYNRHFKWLKQISISFPEHQKQSMIVEILDKLEDSIDNYNTILGLLDKLVKARFIEMFGDPIRNPYGWYNDCLNNVCTKINDGTHCSPESFDKGDYMYITAKNIKQNGLDLSNVTYVSEKVHKPIYQRCNPEFGDILYIKDGATTGIATINTMKNEFTLLSSVALLKYDRSLINGYYLIHLLNSKEMYSKIRKNMGGAAITRLTIAKIKEIKVIVPPIDLQNQFADFVRQVDKSREEVKKSLKKTQQLYDSLMQEYFG
jgi:type I restriction enzyme S subunit